MAFVAGQVGQIAGYLLPNNLCCNERDKNINCDVHEHIIAIFDIHGKAVPNYYFEYRACVVL